MTNKNNHTKMRRVKANIVPDKLRKILFKTLQYGREIELKSTETKGKGGG